MADEVLVRVDGASKKFCRNLRRSLWYGVQDTAADLIGRDGSACGLRPDEFWAVDDVSFELRRGECIGLIGHNGAGKTTLLKMLNGLIKPDRGRIEMRGRVGALIALGAGFNPILTGRENVYVNGSVLGLSKKEIDAKYDDIIAFADIGEFIDTPVQSYSSGMQVRLGFAVATAMEPDVLLLDEVLAVGDAAFRSKCFERIGMILTNAAVIFVSHSEAQISRICNDTILLRNGRIVAQGAPDVVLPEYRLQGESRSPVKTSAVDQRICSVALRTESPNVEWGGQLCLYLDVDVVEECKVGLLLVHVWGRGDFICNGEVSYPHPQELILGPGRGRIKLRLSPLYLQNGNYSVSISAFDETRKRTIVHMLHAASFRMLAPVGTGSSHLVPLEVNAVSAQPEVLHG